MSGANARSVGEELEYSKMENEFPTDEDRMIDRLELHRHIIDYVCSVLLEHNIKHERTRGNSPQGDILIISRDEVPKVQAILKKINTKN